MSYQPYTKTEPIILASQSPRRQQLLTWAKIPFDVVLYPTDESFPAGLSPREAVQHIAREKAEAVAQQGNQQRIVLAADTVVVLDGDIIGKPVDRADALRILHRLSGRTQTVITGVAILQGERSLVFADETEVQFHTLRTEQLEFYVDTYQPYDKAGAYAIQEWIGVAGIAGIKGDFYNVMGLPVSRVIHALDTF